MKIIEIDDKEYEVPENSSELVWGNLSKAVKARLNFQESLDKEMSDVDYKLADMNYRVDLVSAVSGIPKPVLSSCTVEQLKSIVDVFGWFDVQTYLKRSAMEPKDSVSLNVGDDVYEINLDWQKMKYGEFVMMEKMISKRSESPTELFYYLLAILCCVSVGKTDEVEFLSMARRIYDECKLDQCVEAMFFFCQFRNFIFTSYDGIFSQPSGGYSKVSSSAERTKFSQEFGIVNLLYTVAESGVFGTYKDVFNMNVIEGFNYMAKIISWNNVIISEQENS